MTDDLVPPASGERDQLREEAALWFARMRGEEAAQHRAAFERWLARGALHRAAYNRIGEVFAAGKILKHGAAPRDRDDRRRHRRYPIVVVAIAIATLSIIALGRARIGGGLAPRATASLAMLKLAGDRVPRTVPLPGGGSAILDVDALVATGLSGSPNVSRLERGRVRFAMLRGSPHSILVGDREARSSDGIFDLWLRSDGSIDAQVIRGGLEIRPAVLTRMSAAPGALVRLTAGQHYRADPMGRPIDVIGESGLGWPHGVLEFRQAPLGEVVEEANRYSAVKIVLADPVLATRRVSGRFRIDDPVRLARRLTIVLSLVLDEDQPGLLLLRSQEKSPAS